MNRDYDNIFNSGYSDDSSFPHEFSWVEAGGVTPVKDQGHCGACWAFSAIGALEGAYFAKYKELLSFSEQQLVDCADDVDLYNYGNHGCKGGYMEEALKYFYFNSPMLESDYPFTSGATGDDSTDCLYSEPNSS